MSKAKQQTEKWVTYFDDGPTTPFPGYKIKVADHVQSPIAILPVQTEEGKKLQGKRARLIVRVANRHFVNRSFEQRVD